VIGLKPLKIERAVSYSKMEFYGTYYLAFRDLPDLFSKYAEGGKAIDFGCGAGRSTRFLKSLGFKTLGVDISLEMIDLAKEKDPEGNYLIIEDGVLNGLANKSFDLVFSAFTFDNVPAMAKKIGLFSEFHRVLKPGGCVVNLVSSPELYVNDWVSFKTTCFPENITAKSGDIVRTIILDTDDHRPVDDELCTDVDYKEIYAKTGFDILDVHKPLALHSEPYPWVNETRIAPWTIYVLRSD